MILCVCPNPSIDMRVHLEDFAAGDVNRVMREERFPGGKGVHVALALAELGEPTELLGFWGGPTGAWIRAACEERGISCIGPQVAGWTRTCLTFKCSGPANETELLGCGPGIASEDYHRFKAELRSRLGEARGLCFSGSWPPGASGNEYAELIVLANEAGVRTFLDTSGDALRQCLASRPYGIHVNRSEAAAVSGVAEPAAAARALAESCEVACVTGGAAGAWFCMGNRGVHAVCRLDAVPSAVGSGDCLLAGMALGSIRGLDLAEMARLAVACASANCLDPRLGMLRKPDVELLRPRVLIRECDPA